MYLSAWPSHDADGVCRRIVLARPDGKRLTEADYDAIRVALGLTSLEVGEVDIPDWAAEREG